MLYGKALSASKIKTYELCPFKFYLEYILGYKKGQTWATSNGTLIHSTLERYSLGHKKNWSKEMFVKYKKQKPWTLHKEFMTHKKDCVGCEILLNIDHYHGDFFEDVKISAALNYCSEKCPLIEVLRGYTIVCDVLARDPSPLNMKIIGAEINFDIPIGYGVNINGIIDLVLEVEPGVLEIRDWKTGNWLPSYQDALNDPQLRLYDVAAAILYPEYKTRLLTFDYVKNMEYTFSFTDEQREANRLWINEIAKKIKDDTNPKRFITFKCKSFCMKDVCDKEWPQKLIKIKALKKEGKI